MTTTNQPLFSIITVTKDNLNGLKETESSIRAQSAACEWIIVDGDSTDGTKNYLPTLSAQWISEPDGGIYDAMNKGIDRATGEYVLFLNAGDKLADPDILTTLVRAAKLHPDFIYGDALETNGFYKKARSHDKLDWGMFTHHQAMLYRRDRIGPLCYDTKYKIAGDYDFTARFLKDALHVHYIPCAICIFEQGGVSQRQRKDGRREQYSARAIHCSPAKNRIVYTAQSASAYLREKMPGLYFGLRKFTA